MWQEVRRTLLLSGLHPTPCATPYNYSLQLTVSAMEWTLLLMDSILPCAFEWTPPYPPTPQLFLTVISVSHGVDLSSSAFHPPVLLSELHPTPVLGPTAFPYSDHPLLNGLPCTIEWTPPYPLQRTESAMEWTLLLMHSTLPRAIEWTPPYQLQYSAWCRLASVCDHSYSRLARVR